MTTYSKIVKGSLGNYDWPVRFDKSRGYLGIKQTKPGMNPETDRVLLSPSQVKALAAFLGWEKKGK